jgi:hypothetical protein
MRARHWLAAAAGLAGVAAGSSWGWARREPQSRLAETAASAVGTSREEGSSSDATPQVAEAPGPGSPARGALAKAPEPVHAVVERFHLEGAAAEYEGLSAAELTLRMDDLRARRQSLEAETERLHGQHFEALTAGDRARVTDLRQAMARAVRERNQVAAALLIAGYVRGK